MVRLRIGKKHYHPGKYTSAVWRRRHFSLRKLFLFGLILVLLGGLTAVFRFYKEHADYWLHQWESSVLDVTVSLGLSLKNVYLEGQHYTQSEAIIAAMGVELGQPILTIPLHKIRKHLLTLPWVRYAVVERQLPNTLHIRIVERVPVALWQNEGMLHVVDEEGNVVKEGNLAPFSKLILLVGEDAPLYANDLLALLREDSELAKQVSSAIRVGERRWNIRFINGLEVKLPEENADKAWRYLSTYHRQKNLFKQNIASIDLRVPERLYIKPRE